MFSKLVEATIKRGYAVKAGTAANSIIPATSGSAACMLVHAPSVTDVGTEITAGRMEDVLANDDDRLYPAKVGALVPDMTFLMPTSDGSLITATSGNYYCAFAVIGAASGGIAQVVPAFGKLP